MEESRLKTYSPLTLAFLGDAVYGLFMKEHVVRLGNMSANKLHTKTVRLVSAEAQERAVLFLMEEGILTPEEQEVYKRGENAKVENHAKNATDQAYHRATGLESLIGWLYLKEDHDRIEELLTKVLETDGQITGIDN